MQVVKDFESGTKAFRSATVFPEEGSPSTKPPAALVAVRPDARVKNVETKIDTLTEKMAELSLIVKKTSEKLEKASASKNSDEKVKLCSYCKGPNCFASICPKNPHRDTICA